MGVERSRELTWEGVCRRAGWKGHVLSEWTQRPLVTPPQLASAGVEPSVPGVGQQLAPAREPRLWEPAAPAQVSGGRRSRPPLQADERGVAAGSGDSTAGNPTPASRATGVAGCP